MRARIFSGDSWVGGVLVSGVGVEEEGVKDEKMRRTSEV